jgi:glycosyltransferase involved in cell wall biosynthesis
VTSLPAPRRSEESPLTVLYVVHGHASERPGGAETYALELHEAVRETPRLNPVLLAATGPPGTGRPSPHAGTLVEPVGSDPSQYYFHTDAADYDWFLSTARNKDIYTRHLADFLRAYTPDVVHVQHSLFFGFDLLRQIRRTLPNAALVYTLHEYLPMCHRDGQLLRSDGRPCAGPAPRDCASCFPDHSPQDFFLRERFVKGAFDLVDAFVCPSSFLLEKYAAWGIPREKLILEENGRPHVPRVSSPADRPRNRIGYFGQFTPYKGADVLMQAVLQIGHAPHAPTGVMPSVVLHGANLEHAPVGFQQTFRELLADTTDLVRLHGRYRPADLPRLLADVDWVVVPSIWYENAPLVIQEAFQHGRPVICSDIGGMAEKVTDGVDGLHFRCGDPRDLAKVLERAVSSPGLWERLSAGIRPVHDLDTHVANLTRLYRRLISERLAGAGVSAPGAPDPLAADPRDVTAENPAGCTADLDAGSARPSEDEDEDESSVA